MPQDAEFYLGFHYSLKYLISVQKRVRSSRPIIVKHLIFASPKFDDFRRLTYRRSLILKVSHFNTFLKLFSILIMLIETILKVKNMLPMWSIFFPLKVAPLRCGFLDVETHSTFQKMFLVDTDINIYCLLCNWTERR